MCGHENCSNSSTSDTFIELSGTFLSISAAGSCSENVGLVHDFFGPSTLWIYRGVCRYSKEMHKYLTYIS